MGNSWGIFKALALAGVLMGGTFWAWTARGSEATWIPASVRSSSGGGGGGFMGGGFSGGK